MAMEAADWFNASVTYRNLADIRSLLGLLNVSAETVGQALILAHRAENKNTEVASLALQGWIADLRGDFDLADMAFRQAEALERAIHPNMLYLFKQSGSHHATHLRLSGDISYARQVTEANLEVCERNGWLYSLSECRCDMGDLEADLGQHDYAQNHYDEAVKIARGTPQRNILIWALLARGRWSARRGKVASARGDLEEALSYVLDGGHRLYEADIRVGLAWAHLAAANSPRPVGERMGEREAELASARREAERARAMSVEMGYHWGVVDADEVLSAIVG